MARIKPPPHPWMKACSDWGSKNQSFYAVQPWTEEHREWMSFFQRQRWAPRVILALWDRGEEATVPCQHPEWLPAEFANHIKATEKFDVRPTRRRPPPRNERDSYLELKKRVAEIQRDLPMPPNLFVPETAARYPQMLERHNETVGLHSYYFRREDGVLGLMVPKDWYGTMIGGFSGAESFKPLTF